LLDTYAKLALEARERFDEIAAELGRRSSVFDNFTRADVLSDDGWERQQRAKDGDSVNGDESIGWLQHAQLVLLAAEGGDARIFADNSDTGWCATTKSKPASSACQMWGDIIGELLDELLPEYERKRCEFLASQAALRAALSAGHHCIDEQVNVPNTSPILASFFADGFEAKSSVKGVPEHTQKSMLFLLHGMRDPENNSGKRSLKVKDTETPGMQHSLFPNANALRHHETCNSDGSGRDCFEARD